MRPSVIVVVGSAMMDLTAYADVLPEPGQTLAGQLFTTGFGGKGANQAVMAANCGAQVHFIGKLGDDVFGKAIADNFVKVGINSQFVETSATPNGVAHIWVDGKGENRIIIIPGANHEIETGKAVEAINSIQNLEIVVAQCEIKQEVTLAAFRAAKARGCTTILNPAPYQEISAELLDLCDWIIPNETEFRELHGSLPASDEILRTFRPGKNSIVTLGSKGAVYISAGGQIHHAPAPQVTAVDTTGAGDSFTSALAVAISEGRDFHECVKFATASGSHSVGIAGVIDSLPTREEIEKCLAQ